jgi:hypothetical protein
LAAVAIHGARLRFARNDESAFRFYALARGTLASTTTVFSTGQTATHWGASKWPRHSVHFFALMTNVPPFATIATLGHSASQAPHAEHDEAMIL